ncbi:MAG: XRE family transcriptional regulator [Alphaproteobacteria bacterium]|nr:XRE family transcriptional regulator [Alphaproteobacteria bacterium]
MAIAHERSTGNVFSDLGLAEPEKHRLKAELCIKVADLIRCRNLNQADAAKLLRIDQPKVSALLNTRISGFSVERLLSFLTMLGHNVHISIDASETSKAGISVEMG